jgi:uncharacterized protein (DUF3084 family)
MSPPLTMALTIAALAAIGLGAVIIRRLNVIHVLVNSNLSQVKAELARALAEIGSLREELGGAEQKVEEAEEARGHAKPETGA